MNEIKNALKETKRFSLPSKQVKILARDIVEFDGQARAKITPTAFKDLLNIIGLNEKIVNHLNMEIDEKAGYTVAKVLMDAMAAKRGLVLDFIISEDDGEVKRIATEGLLQSGLNPNVFEELIDFGVDQSKGKLIVTNRFITDGGTKASVNLKWNDPIALKIKGEDITVGKQLTWDLLGPTTYGDMIERLICTNGMTTTSYANFRQLDSNADPEQWYNLLFKDLKNPNEQYIANYEQKVLEAMNANLSVFEYNKLLGYAMENWKYDGNIIMRYFGDSRFWKDDYKKRGIDLNDLNVFQLRNCPTPIKAWDVVNCLTDLASHTYLSDVSDATRKHTQRYAGKLLDSPWDARAQIYNVPQYK